MTDEELTELRTMVDIAAKGIEDRLIASFGTIIAGLNTKISQGEKAASDLESKATTAFNTLPVIIKTQVENQLKDLTKQLEAGKSGDMSGGGESADGESGGGAPRGGNSGGFGGFNVGELLQYAPKVIEMINAWKQPGTEQQMMGQMNLIFRWHGLLSKLEKGGGSGEDITTAVADTFNKI